MGQDFRGNFQVKVTGFLPFSTASLTESDSLGYGLKNLLTLHKSAVKFVLDH